MSTPRISLRDIAQSLQVSTMTVSRALRGRPGVSEELRQQIITCAEKLGYRPDPTINRLVQHLRQRRQIGVQAVIAAVTDIPKELNPVHFSQICSQAEQQAKNLGFAFSLMRMTEGPGGWARLFNSLHARGVDGVLLLPMIYPITIEQPDWSRFSVVAATASVTTPIFNRIAPNHALNARLMIENLKARGHRRIGYVGTQTHNLRTLEAFPAALAWHHAQTGQSCQPLLHSPTSRPDIVAWARKEQPDAVIVGRETDLGYFQEELLQANLRTKWYLAGIEQSPPPAPGIDERAPRIGLTAVNVLGGMIIRGERGIPEVPTSTLIPGVWMNG